jgi:HlyD family secretion protein
MLAERRVSRALASVALAVLLTACSQEKNPPFVGSLEWDRVAVTAELAEPVLRWDVAEGDRVEAGTPLLEQDPRRQDARIAAAHGDLMQAEGKLLELTNGARIETIDTARANLAKAHAAESDAQMDYDRNVELKKRDLIAGAAVDQSRATLAQAKASTKAQEAQLLELTHGTRPEQIDQAHAAVAAAKGTLEQLELTRARLTIRAPRAGRVDALPFHPGDQPPVGAALVSMLVGEAPYARVFVPAPRRGNIKQGDAFDVKLEDGRTFTATVRSIRSEASFTPYYALAGDDAARLVYRAELVLQGDGAADLPAGLPVSAYVKAP